MHIKLKACVFKFSLYAQLITNFYGANVMKIRHLLLSATMIAGTTSLNQTANAGTDVFLGEITMHGANFCPRGTAALNGQILSIASNSALFSLLGTTYGGDGRTSFGLPDTRGRSMIGPGTGAGLPPVSLGQRGGTTNFTLTESQMPSHSHRTGIKAAQGTANSTDPTGRAFATTASNTFVDVPAGPVAGNRFLHEGTVIINASGEGQQIQKRSPYLVVTQCIALQGIFPSRN